MWFGIMRVAETILLQYVREKILLFSVKQIDAFCKISICLDEYHYDL